MSMNDIISLTCVGDNNMETRSYYDQKVKQCDGNKSCMKRCKYNKYYKVTIILFVSLVATDITFERFQFLMCGIYVSLWILLYSKFFAANVTIVRFQFFWHNFDLSTYFPFYTKFFIAIMTCEISQLFMDSLYVSIQIWFGNKFFI